MGAGLAGSTTKIYGNANVNQIQYGDKLQGLPPVTGRRDPYRIYKTKAGGNAPDRFRVFCVNQLGGIGMANKNSQFAPNADGLGWCPNRKNSREGDIGINKADRGHDAIRFQSRADLKAEFAITKHGTCSFSAKMITDLNRDLESLRNSLSARGVLGADESLVAMGNDHETTSSDIGIPAGPTITLDANDSRLTSQDKVYINDINAVLSNRCLWVNRHDNGKNGASLGIHVLKIIKTDDIPKLFNAGYGVLHSPDGFFPIINLNEAISSENLNLFFFSFSGESISNCSCNGSGACSCGDCDPPLCSSGPAPWAIGL